MRVILSLGILPLAACAVLGPVADADMEDAPYQACARFAGAAMPDTPAAPECVAVQVRQAGGRWQPFTGTLSAGDELLAIPSAAPQCTHGNYTHFVLEGSSAAGAMRIAVSDGFGRGDRRRPRPSLRLARTAHALDRRQYRHDRAHPRRRPRLGQRRPGPAHHRLLQGLHPLPHPRRASPPPALTTRMLVRGSAHGHCDRCARQLELGRVEPREPPLVLVGERGPGQSALTISQLRTCSFGWKRRAARDLIYGHFQGV